MEMFQFTEEDFVSPNECLRRLAENLDSAYLRELAEEGRGAVIEGRDETGAWKIRVTPPLEEIKLTVEI